MSVEHSSLVWKLSERLKLHSSTVLVLLALADRANPDTGECWPGKRDIARRCGLTVKTVYRQLKILEKQGLVKIKQRLRPNKSKTTNMYTLTLGTAPPTGHPCPVPTGHPCPPPKHHVEPSCQNPNPPPPKIDTTKRNKQATANAAALCVFDYHVNILGSALGREAMWRATIGLLAKIKARLKTFSIDECTLAIDNLACSPYNLGENDGGREYCSPTFLFRSDEQVSDWMAKERHAADGNVEKACKRCGKNFDGPRDMTVCYVCKSIPG